MKKTVSTLFSNITILAFAFLFNVQFVQAQYVVDFKKSADKAYAKGDWYTAAVYYEKYLEGKNTSTTTYSSGYEPYSVQKTGAKKKANATSATSDNEVVYRIAECYRKLNDFGKAQTYYAKATGFGNSYPLARYYYGVALRANNRYAEAEKQFEAFLAGYTTKDIYSEEAKKELANCKYIQQQLARKDADQYKLGKINAAASTSGSNYAPTYNGSQLVFTSSRVDSNLLKLKYSNPYINNLYTVDGTSVQKFAISNEGFEQGAASFTANGKRVYFTRWKKIGGKNISAIYLSENKNGSWGEPVKLGTNVNAEGSSSKQPYISADGKYLLYSSDRTGGQGGFDIWVSFMNDDGEPGNFENLGKNINTPANEEAPYYSTGTKSLVFASNGFTGMGGFDLFESKGIFPKAWGVAQNLGSPVNSVKDDIYFVNSGSIKLLKDAIISTDRSSSCCLELFNLNKTYKKYVAGKATDCKTNEPLAGVNINVTDKATGKNIVTKTTDANGNYIFEVAEFKASVLSGSKADYNNGTIEFTAPAALGNEDDTLQNIVVCLQPIEKVIDTTPVVKQEPMDEKSVYFDFALYSLRPETKQVLDTLANILKREKNLGVEILGYTDQIGSNEYNMKLSQQRADACLEYLVQKGVDRAKLKATAKGVCCPVEQEKINGKDNPAGRQANRRVEFKIKLIM